jgi:6-phosphogluconolactonase (cycloisomerase 2 family)
MIRTLLAAAALAAAATLNAQTFQVVICETPPGSGGFQPIERFLVAGSNGPMTRISDIPPSVTNDPIALAFDNQYELFVANRAGHSGNGSVSRFTFDGSFGTFQPNGTITGNGLTDPVQIAFNPVDGELFVTNWRGGILSRFRFDAQGNAVPSGTLQMPDGGNQLGVAIRALDQQLFVSSYTAVRRFARQANGSYTHLGDMRLTGGGNLIHFMAFRGDELYVAEYSQGLVHRFGFDAGGNPVAQGTVAVPGAVAIAFSPDRDEMFVARHAVGGFQRFRHDAPTDSWIATTLQTGPSAGGIATTVHWFSVYGDGCAGTGGLVPTLQGLGVPLPGNTIYLQTQNGLPGGAATIVVSLAPGSVPFLGCTWLQSLVLVNTPPLLLDQGGAHRYSIRMPLDLPPIDFYFQTFVLDLGAPNGLFSATAGLRASVL